ncbi:hypothetical protein BGX27_003204, partial [Mortierella sp. AM989]
MNLILYPTSSTILRDISKYLKSYNKKAITEFWAAIAQRENQEAEHAKMMQERRSDLRRQNIKQLRIDGDALTKELEEGYVSESSSVRSDEVILVQEPGTRNDPSTAKSSTSSSSTRTPSSRLAGKRSVEQAPDAANKKQRGSTQKGVIAGTSRSEDHDRDHDDHHVHHHGHEDGDEDDDHDNSDADNNNTADFLPRSLFDKGENLDQYFFESPVSAWKDIRAFCKKVLDSKYETSWTTAFRRYTRSLLIIAKKTGVEEQIQNCAKEAFNVQYTSVANQMAQQAAENISKRSNGQEAPTDGQDVPSLALLIEPHSNPYVLQE